MDYREVFNRGLRHCPDKDVIVDGERRFTYRQWGERHRRLANALLGLGLKKGDHLGLLLKNSAECFDAYAAGAVTGIVVVPINYRLSAEAIAHILEQTGCRALVIDAEFLDLVRERRPRLPRLETLIVVGADAASELAYEALLAAASAVEPQAEHADDDPAVVIYTTGTTGAPKGAVATRQIMLTRMLIIIIEMGLGPQDRYLNAMPIFHIGIVQALALIWRCGTNITLRDFTADSFGRDAARYGATKTFLTPAAINAVLNSPQTAPSDLASLKLILYGAAPMLPETLKRVARTIPGCGLLQAYGTSECYALIYLSPAEHQAALDGDERAQSRMASVGRTGMLAQAKVVREDHSEAPIGEVGEVLLKSRAIMSGYLGKAAETAEAIRGGWFRTRDLARVDADGYVYLVDRKDHMIITGGENVYPAQVENVLYDHPAVAEAAVIGVPDTTWGEAVKALIVLKAGEQLSERDVIDFCAPRMAGYAKPKSVEFVSELPHTATGKLDKLALRRQYWPGSG